MLAVLAMTCRNMRAVASRMANLLQSRIDADKSTALAIRNGQMVAPLLMNLLRKIASRR